MDPNLLNRMLDLAIAIQQIPAPTFHEGQRAAFIKDRFLAEGLGEVTQDEQGNVYACREGRAETSPVVLSAHIDTVFPLETNLQIQHHPDWIAGPGIGDNCLGVAGLFGLLWALQEEGEELPGDLWLAANVGEEGLGDLRGMRAVVERFGEQPLAYLILEGMALGQVYHRALGVRRYRITVRTGGGHSWVDYGKPSAVHELAGLITRITALTLPIRPRTTLNVGVIRGGTTVNTIAAEAHLELDLRSEGDRNLVELAERVEGLVRAANRPGIQVTAEVIGRRPAGKISARHPLVRLARRCLEDQKIDPHLGIGSTDANIPLSRNLPAVCVGLSTGGGAHTLGEYIHIRPLQQGMGQLVGLVKSAYQELA